jgi:hypothetical protein
MNKEDPKKTVRDAYDERDRRLQLAVEFLAWSILLGVGVLVFVMMEVVR